MAPEKIDLKKTLKHLYVPPAGDFSLVDVFRDAVPAGAAVDESSFPTTSAEDAERIIVDGIEDDDLHI